MKNKLKTQKELITAHNRKVRKSKRKMSKLRRL